MSSLGFRAALTACIITAATVAVAQPQPRIDRAGQGHLAAAQSDNTRTIGIISGGADGTYIRVASDLANVLDSDELRILPIVGRGSVQNLRAM